MRLKNFVLFFFILLVGETGFSQTSFFHDEPVNWQEFKRVEIPKDFSKYVGSDLVFIDDNTEFWFYRNNHGVMRLMTFYIANEKGLQELKKMKLPESFDPAFDSNFHKQGRATRIKIPYLTDYKVKKFSARKHSSGKWSQLKFNDRYEKIRWIKQSGEFGDEDISVFEILDISVGDIVQVFYESSFQKSYGSNLFYFYSAHPKMNVEYTFSYRVDNSLSNFDFLLPINLRDSSWSRKRVLDSKDLLITDRVRLRNVSPINYPTNSFEGKNLSHVFLDLSFFPMVRESYPDAGSRIYSMSYVRPLHFEWLYLMDTVNNFTKIYDKHFAAIRKFSATLPPFVKDSNNTTFFKALCDSFNSFRYLTKNDLFYNQSNLYDLASTEHLAKRRLVGSSSKLCRDILNEKGIFYYKANIQDNRYGVHSMHYRAHFAYEWNLIAIPNKTSYCYFMSRLGGVKYQLNELPFYLEGTLASLYPMNFQEGDTAKDLKFFKFIRTHKGTFNENTRTENATVKIELDSKEMDFTGKESLSGQFSTILRHLYLNEFIDSTISPNYYKRCTDKPGASDIRVKLSSKITDFPFRHTFNCSEKIKLTGANKINLTNWFSFTLNSKILPEAPAHDYFFDFDFSDAYNFLLDFDSPIQLKNADIFNKKLNNAYFELDSEIIKNSETSYLIKAKLIVKQGSIPLADMQLLMDLVKDLDALNNFTLELEKKG